MTKKLTTSLIIAGALIATSAVAKVPNNVADRLGRDLTPMGAEKAGNRDGTIPSWTGRGISNASQLLSGWDESKVLPDPYPNDRVQFSITPQNMGQYADKLSEGNKALLRTYPSYKMDVYQTRRNCVYPKFVYDAAKRNAQVGMLVDGGNGISEAIMASPFPIPNNGLEVVWNHTLRYRGHKIQRQFNYAVPTAGGAYTLTYTTDEVVFPYSDKMNRRAEDLDNISIYFVAHTSAPARSAGNVVLVHETLNMAKEGRKAWTYSPGTRRVRRAPNIAYDNPVTNGDGMGTSDQYDAYNGAPDRYDWTVRSKSEKYVMSNNYKMPLASYKELVKPKHANPDLVRYELRRVWTVEGNLKSSARHIYAKRRLHYNEDSWQIAGGELYDGRGELWRIQQIAQAADYRPETQTCWTHGGEYSYDILSGRYLMLAGKSGRPTTKASGLGHLNVNYYNPSNIRRLGR
jgi:hypothetical protein